MPRDTKGLLIFFLIAVLVTGAQGATLHGTVYEWQDFEKPLRNAIVEVNSTPVQYTVATAGIYSFNLSPGNYLIKAKYYRNNVLELSTEEEIQVGHEGDFIRDLLLFPPTDTEYEYLGDINFTDNMDVKNEVSPYIYIVIILIVILSAIIIFYRLNKSNSDRTVINETPLPPPAAVTGTGELPSDLQELYSLILKTGGRSTQKELRKKTSYSEARVSLMLDDLENRGFIKKIKKGRSNIIIAEVQKN
ncbi:helix-turn-helix transcriptional regulator [Candidatus Methanoperedens nitratireducens]|uniref:Uncharacterized membrane-associated protein n=1 Tax=Candidatus Methanoperedens nitratireducens TaxID=1392998 RepID=A0A284VRG0_9EURY|nr:hypothetical protein [Candidatus Methanoperedens nitroreducens]SNQ61852.1 Uncharacterized membrane-associated protein [Candidatus Methanoperedens nitroreducens]